MKSAALGLLIGAILGAAGVRLADRARTRPPEESTPGAPAESGPKADAAATARLEKELESARGEKAALEKKVADLEATAAARPEKAAAGKTSRWKDVGAAFYRLKDKMNDENAGNSPEAQQAIMELLGMLGKLAKEHGVSLEEVAACPDAIPAFLLSILEAAGVQPGAAQQAAMDAAMADGQEAWKDYLAKREGLTAYERKRALLDLSGGMMDHLRDAIGGDGRQVADDMKIFDANFNFGGSTRGFGGDGATVAGQLRDSWAKDLKLDESQKPALGLAVDEYLAGLQAAKDEFARREAAGQKVTSREREAAQLDAMIRAQKRLGETLRLSDAQAKALRDWATTYSADVDPSR
ncbi:MAG: hypothetical protein IT452_22785 [Planctomycetia bacterium]|nr:hypothetical protein [Planctomycetia bacterium]